jgi:hypothetical protein
LGQYPDFDERLYVPRVSLALTYSHERGRATAGWARGATANLFGGDTTINNQYFLNIGMPLPTRRRIALTTQAAYGTGEIIDTEIGEARGTTERISGDIGLAMELNQAWNLGVRFQSSKQILVNFAPMMDIESTVKQTSGVVVLQGRFPEEMAAQVPPLRNDRVESANESFEDVAAPAQGPGASNAPRP